MISPSLRPIRVSATIAAAVATGLAAQDAAEFRFRFGPDEPRAFVRVVYTGVDRDELTVAMPAWKPGSYTIHDFGRNVIALHAERDDGAACEVDQVDTNTWRIDTRGIDRVAVVYELRTKTRAGFGPGYSLGAGLGRALPETGGADAGDGATADRGTGAREPGARDEPRRRRYRAYEFEGPATWLHVPDRVAIPHRVHFDLPDEWSVHTGMRADGASRTFTAPDYDVFADCPFHVGVSQLRAFDVDGVRYEIVWSGFEHLRGDLDAIAARYRDIVRAHLEMFGSAPFERYVFLIGFPGAGGLEHLNSTTIGMLDLGEPAPGRSSMWDSVVSHEFFHVWNVKRLRPRPLGPFDYSGPVRTPYLWFAEGVTSYYGDLLLVRAGAMDADSFWTDTIAGEIRTLQANPGRLRMSVAEASRTVWDAPYMRRGRSAPDYYNKGTLLGLLLDVEIRDATDGARSLDDVMRALYEQCTTSGAGFAEGDVQKACEAAAGRSFADFFARFVEGTDELPFAEVLAKVGLTVVQPRPVERAGRPPAAIGRWDVRIDAEASERALRLRERITRRVVFDAGSNTDLPERRR